MTTSYGSLCDDFYINMRVNTELELPEDRDTILHFFDRVQKQYPTMNTFFQRDDGAFCLSEDTEAGSYKKVIIGPDHVFGGAFNPAAIDEVDDLNRFVLDHMTYALGVNHLDVNNLELMYAMDFDYDGNHDEVFAEALFKDTPISNFLDMPDAAPLGFAPSFLIGLTEDCRLQAKVSFESNTGAYNVRTGKYSDCGSLSVYLTIRQYPVPSERFDCLSAYEIQKHYCETLMNDKVIPNIITPIVGALSHRR